MIAMNINEHKKDLHVSKMKTNLSRTINIYSNEKIRFSTGLFICSIKSNNRFMANIFFLNGQPNQMSDNKEKDNEKMFNTF